MRNKVRILPLWKVIGETAWRVFCEGNTRQVVHLANEKQMIKVTRRYKVPVRNCHDEAVITIGKPSYRERQYIRRMKKNGGSFPVTLIQNFR